ncbi:MAG: MarR family transcriptional regulator [Candidatus Thermoplasmatota archaeon]
MGTKSLPWRIFFLVIFLGFLSIPLHPSLQAVEYYADLTITVDSYGFVSIDGLTNYPNFTIYNTENYTSKNQSYWLLNITKPDLFSEFVYEVRLPKGSSISYIRTSGTLRIEEQSGSLILRGFGENESFRLLIQYQTEKPSSSFLEENIVYFLLLSAIVLVSILTLFLFFKEKKIKQTPTPLVTKEPLREFQGLNHRQKQILQLLQARNIPLTQTDIQKELQIPKASVSRNILGLERRGLIEKEQIGMSNLIRLKKP